MTPRVSAGKSFSGGGTAAWPINEKDASKAKVWICLFMAGKVFVFVRCRDGRSGSGVNGLKVFAPGSGLYSTGSKGALRPGIQAREHFHPAGSCVKKSAGIGLFPGAAGRLQIAIRIARIVVVVG